MIRPYTEFVHTLQTPRGGVEGAEGDSTAHGENGQPRDPSNAVVDDRTEVGGQKGIHEVGYFCPSYYRAGRPIIRGW